MQAARGHAHVEVGGVRRQGLQHVEGAQADVPLGVWTRHLQPGPFPQVTPGDLVLFQEFAEAGRESGPAQRGRGHVGERQVARRGECHRLDDRDGVATVQRQHACLLDMVVVPLGLGPASAAGGDVDPRGQGDLDAGGAGPRAEPRQGLPDPRRVPCQVVAPQVAVPCHSRVGHPAVEPGAYAERPRPVLRREGRLQRGQVGVGHRDQAALPYGRDAAVGVPEPDQPVQDGVAHVQVLPVPEQVRRAGGEPRAAGRREGQRQPVRQVDHVLVGQPMTRDVRGEPVVASGDVGPRVVDGAGPGLRCRASRGEPAVAQRAQRLAQPLVTGIEPLVSQRPRIRRGSS